MVHLIRSVVDTRCIVHLLDFFQFNTVVIEFRYNILILCTINIIGKMQFKKDQKQNGHKLGCPGVRADL